MKIFEPKILTALKSYSKKQLASDIVAGLIVAIIALPLSIALAIASGVGPEQGLYTAIVAGFVIALFGGSRVNISGPTAAFATIVAGIVATEGMDGLVIATLLAGVLLILFGICRLGSLIKYIPLTITTGFTAGIAVTIVIGQLKDFFGLTPPAGTTAVETVEKVKMVIESITTINWQGFAVGVVALAILIVWPKISKKIPGSLVVVLLGALAVKLFDLPVTTIGDLYTIPSTLPTVSLPAGLSLSRIAALLPNAFTIALLAAIESLLSCVVSDGMIDDRHNSNTELIAQGLGNIASGLFGGIPATGAIARTAANVNSGGRSPVSGIVHAVVLLLILVVLMPYAAFIPMPVIAAILLMVAYNMSEWRRFVRIVRTAPLTDTLVLVLTFVLTVVFDLVVAIAAGLILAAVFFLKRSAELAEVRAWDGEAEGRALPAGVAVYEITGPMFFAATDKFLKIETAEETRSLILRLSGVTLLDSTAEREIEKLCDRCARAGVALYFAHVHEQPLSVLKKCGVYDRVGAEHFCSHLDDALAKIEE